MSDNAIVYIIVAILIAHLLFAIGYLIYKILNAPKSSPESKDQKAKDDIV
jgi:hypothetical protein